MLTRNDLPVVLILAAGAGRRYRASGGATYKLDALIAGRSVLDHVRHAVQESGLPAYIVRQAPGPGMGDSIAAGVAATAQANGWLVLPGDLPAVRADTIARIAQALSASRVVVPRWQERAGHPVGFAADCGPALMALSGEKGASGIVQMQRGRGSVTDLAVDDPGILLDVDTVADLARAEAYLRAPQQPSENGRTVV